MRLKLKKLFSLTLAVALFCSIAGFSAEANSKTFVSEKLNNKNFLPAYSTGSPIVQTQVVDGRVGQEDGVNVLYASSMGTPAVFNVFDLDNGKLLRTFKLPGSGSVWTHGIDSKGNVYMSTQDRSFLFRYSPVTKELENLGSVNGQGATYDMVFDEDDNVYVGAYPAGIVVKYDPKAKQFTSFPPPQEGNKYIRSLGYYNGYLYAGTFGNGGMFFKINKETGDSERIQIPTSPDYGDIDNIYAITAVRNYMFLMTNIVGGTKVMLIYDAEKGAFLEQYALAPQGGYATPELNGKTYFSAGGYMHELDLETGVLTKTDKKFGLYSRGGNWIDANIEGFVGKTFVTVTYGGNPMFYNIETNKYANRTDMQLSGTGIQLHNLNYSKQADKVLMSGYVAATGSAYDPDDGTFSIFAMGQAENSYDGGEYMYFGIYPGAHIHRTKVDKDGKFASPQRIFTVGEEQDRPYGAGGGDGKIFFGTVPDYGKLGGALVVYDEATETQKVYRNVVRNQSVIGLAYKDGLVYGSTSIGPGLGVDPTESEARMFIFDLKSEKVIKEFIPNFPTDKVPGPIKQIGALTFGPDGLLWGAVRNYVFALDPKTLEIKKDVLIAPITWVSGNYWRPVFLRFGSDGTLYVSENGVSIIDIDTMEVLRLKQYSGVDGSLMTLDSDDNVYVADASKLLKITAVKNPISEENKKALDAQFADSVVLRPENNLAVVNGVPKAIDSENKAVSPVIINGRTLVPLRFLSESFGGTVGWDEDTKTVSVKINGKSVSLVIDQQAMTVDGKTVTLDVPAMTLESRTMLPLRALVETVLEKEVFWDDAGLIYVTDSKEKVNTMTDELTKTMIHYYEDYVQYDYAIEQVRLQKEAKDLADKELAPYRINLLNGDFEDTKPSENVKRWTSVYGKSDQATYAVSDKKSYKGSNALYFEDTSESMAVALLSTPFVVKEGAKLITKVELFIEEGRTSFAVRFYDASMNEVSTEVVHVNTGIGSWQEIELEAKVPAGAILARVMPTCSNLYMTKAYYDNIRVYQFEK